MQQIHNLLMMWKNIPIGNFLQQCSDFKRELKIGIKEIILFSLKNYF
jgi:hypothetical protein